MLNTELPNWLLCLGTSHAHFMEKAPSCLNRIVLDSLDHYPVPTMLLIRQRRRWVAI